MTVYNNNPTHPIATMSTAELKALLPQHGPFPLVSKLDDMGRGVPPLELTPPDSPTSKDEAENHGIQSILEVMLEYADRVSGMMQKSDAQEEGSHGELLRALIDYVDQTVLASRNIHTVVASFSIPDSQKSALLYSYYEALHAAQVSPGQQRTGLFGSTYSDTKGIPTTIYTVFGGQGLRSNPIQELSHLFQTYPSLSRDLIQDSTSLMVHLSTTDASAEQLLPQGLDILSWLQDPTHVPALAYLGSAPVSVPLIGLVQLAHYQVTCKTLGLTPGQFRSRISGTTGHSQGIITAAATSVADDWPSWRKATRAAMATLFWIGIRTQQVWNAQHHDKSISEAMIQDSADHDERAPSPMLSVRGLTREHLQTCIDATGRYLKDGGRCLAISMVNGPRNFVVSGPARYLYGLNLQIRKRKQIVIQDSLVKADIVRSSFLDVSVPFHTGWLKEAILMIQHDIKHLQLQPNATMLPIFSAEDGQDLGRQCDNLLPKLVELVVCRGLDWGKATALVYPEPTLDTQTRSQKVLDFGPGGIHGINSLSPAIDGVHTILVGILSGKGAAVGYKGELYG
ncbi:hypothetical protein F66182_7568 [Fusarium sp. NRRL 66182]|nr:hypothetical protein F66182_7568 [Fusarium sp. NRRL 66182]